MLRTTRIAMIGGGAILLIALTVSTGVASLARTDQPGTALRFAPFDAKAQEVMADRSIFVELNDRDWRQAELHARAALARSPLSPVATRVLGFVKDNAGEKAHARQLMLQSAILTRRDLNTRIWLIEDAVARNDVPGALNEFDIAMRRSRTARQLMFPVLASALEDPAFVKPVTELFKRSPNWAAEFLQIAIASGEATENLAIIVARSPQIRALDGDVRQQVIQQFVKENKFGAARRFEELFSRKSGETLNDAEFNGVAGYQPFVWVVTSEVSHGATLGDGLEFHAEGGAGGPVVRQLLTLEPGRYQLTSSGYSTPSSGGGARWTMHCGGDYTGNLGEVALPVKSATVAFDVEVPTKCAAQWLALDVQGGAAAGGVTGHIRRIDIRPQSH